MMKVSCAFESGSGEDQKSTRCDISNVFQDFQVFPDFIEFPDFKGLSDLSVFPDFPDF